MLVDAAEQAGVRVLRGARVGKVSRIDAGLRIQADEPVLAATVVDATGRTARVARALGANRAQFDRMVSACLLYTSDAADE